MALPLLIHYHIFKNAGTSFEWALEKAFGSGLATYDSPVPNGFVSAESIADFVADNPGIRAIASHQAAPPAPQVPEREVFTSILIRDPLARVRSIYAFERGQQAESPGAIKAKELDFKAYVDWRLDATPAIFCNYQVHFCTRTAQPSDGPAGQDELEKAIEHLDNLSIVGTVSRYNDWLSVAQKVLSRPFPEIALKPTRQNVTATTRASESEILDQLIDDLGESTAQHLIENNQLDMCLHQIADSILTRKMAEEGLELALARAYAQAQEHRRAKHPEASDLSPEPALHMQHEALAIPEPRP